jgi:F0F1-type ATP synthase membrane subunit c/vacuolar-type H+-ATPase subunit K
MVLVGAAGVVEGVAGVAGVVVAVVGVAGVVVVVRPPEAAPKVCPDFRL